MATDCFSAQNYSALQWQIMLANEWATDLQAHWTALTPKAEVISHLYDELTDFRSAMSSR